MLKAYKFRLYPENVQISKINSFIVFARFVYNHYFCLKQKKYNENNINYSVFDMKKSKWQNKKFYKIKNKFIYLFYFYNII